MNKQSKAQEPLVHRESPQGVPVEVPSLRDQIAMRAPAMPAWWANTYITESGQNIDAKALAAWAYEYADAMVAERAK